MEGRGNLNHTTPNRTFTVTQHNRSRHADSMLGEIPEGQRSRAKTPTRLAATPKRCERHAAAERPSSASRSCKRHDTKSERSKTRARTPQRRRKSLYNAVYITKSSAAMAPADRKLMDTRSIAQALSVLGTGLVHEELQNPQPDRIQTIFQAFFIKMMDVSESYLRQLPISVDTGENGLDIREFHLFSNGIPLLILCRMTNSFYCDLFGADFTMTDMLMPTPQRIREFISYLVSFIRFRGLFEPFQQEVVYEMREKLRAVDDVLQQNQILEEEKTEARKQADSRKRRENQLNEEKYHLQKELRNLMEQSDAQKAEIARLENAFNECNDRKATIQLEKHHLEERDRFLAEEIVDNPEERTEERARQRAEIGDLKKSIDESRRKVAEHSKIEDLLRQVNLGMERGSDVVKQLQEEKEKLETLLVDELHKRQELDQMQKEVNDKKFEVEVSKERLVESRKQHVQTAQTYEKKQVDLQERKEQLHLDVAAAEERLKSQGAIDEQLRQKNAELSQIKFATAQLHSQHKERIVGMVEKYKELVKKEREGMKSLQGLYDQFKDGCTQISDAIDTEDVTISNMSNTLSRSSISAAPFGHLGI